MLVFKQYHLKAIALFIGGKSLFERRFKLHPNRERNELKNHICIFSGNMIFTRLDTSIKLVDH